jgi:hypothetical protein
MKAPCERNVYISEFIEDPKSLNKWNLIEFEVLYVSNATPSTAGMKGQQMMPISTLHLILPLSLFEFMLLFAFHILITFNKLLVLNIVPFV